VLAAVLGVVAALLLAIFAIRLLSNGGSGLAHETFDANAAAMAKRISADGPILFQDLLGGGKDLYLQHLGDDRTTGWHAFRATAPGAARTCTLSWDRAARVFRDTRCGTGATFPEDGAGRESYAVTVLGKNQLQVDLRRPA
jgi:hypothetical protein